MSTAIKKSALLFFIVLPVLSAGCGGKGEVDPQPNRKRSELVEIHEMCRNYSKTNQHPPKKLSDLNTKLFQGTYPVGLQALQQGQYIAVWGVPLGNSGTVLAYEKDAPK